MNKLSDRLKHLLDSNPPHEAVTIHALLKRGLPRQDARHALSQIRDLAIDRDSVNYLASGSIILCDVKFESIAEVARLPQVVWIDAESEAPLETLLDD